MTTNTRTPGQATLVGLLQDRLNPGGDPEPLDIVDVASQLTDADIDSCVVEAIRQNYAAYWAADEPARSDLAGEAVARIAREREISPAEAIGVLAHDVGVTPAVIDRLL